MGSGTIDENQRVTYVGLRASDLYKRFVMSPLGGFRKTVAIPCMVGDSSFAWTVSKKSIEKFSLEEVTNLALSVARRKGYDVNLTIQESMKEFERDPLYHSPW